MAPDRNENLDPCFFWSKKILPPFICGHLSKPSPGMEKLDGFATETPAIETRVDPIGWFVVQPSWSQHTTHFLEDLQRFRQVIHRDGICNHIEPEIFGTFQHQKRCVSFWWLFFHGAFFGGEASFWNYRIPENWANGTRCFPILDIKPWTIMMNLWIILSHLWGFHFHHLTQVTNHWLETLGSSRTQKKTDFSWPTKTLDSSSYSPKN